MSSIVTLRIAPWISENLMLNIKPQTSRICWLPEAVQHPALLCATLLAGAVHLNRVTYNKYLDVVTRLKIETIQLLNEDLKGASDEAIMTAIILLFFTVSNLPELEESLTKL